MSNNTDLLLRQWTMLRMIPRFPRKVTAREMMGRLEDQGFKVTKRTIERDLQWVSTIFPLVSDEREKPYGWSWSKDAPTFDLPGLTANEALTFKLAQQHLRRLMPTKMLLQLAPYFAAADKRLSEISQDNNKSDWQHKISVAPAWQPLIAPEVDADVLAIVESALLENRQIKLSYATRKERAEYTAHPLGIILRGQMTYLACTLFNYSDVRLLAIHRIQYAEMLLEAGMQPDNFTIQDYAESSALGFGLGFDENQAIDLIVKFNKEAGLHLLETPLSANQTVEETKDSLLLKAQIADTPQLRWWLLGFGGQVEVIGPANLREFMIAQVNNLERIYK